MRSEEETVQRIRAFPIPPGYEWARQLTEREFCYCCRLHLFPYDISGTLCVAQDWAVFRVVSMATPRDPQFGPFFSRFIGESEVPVKAAFDFIEQLQRLGVWDLGDCLGGGLHGIMAIHAIAAKGEDHSFFMENPQYHDDLRYLQIIRLYSHHFFDDVLSEWADTFLGS